MATSTVATKVKAGTNTASPGPTPSAINASSSASVPLAQLTQCRAPQKSASRRLELADLGPQHELAVVQHFGDRPLDAIAKPFALRGEIDKGGNGLLTLSAHAISTEAPWHILTAEGAKSA